MMRRYLLVLDMDLLAVDEHLGLEPISYLHARHEEQPSEVVVADHRQARLPALELLLGTSSNITKFPVAPQADHDIGAAAGIVVSFARSPCGPVPARHWALS